MNTASTGINNIVNQNIPIELPSNESKTVSLGISVSVDSEKTTREWEFVWRATRFTSGDDNPRYCYEFSLFGKSKEKFKYGKSFYKIKIVDSKGRVLVEESSDLTKGNSDQFKFSKLMTFGEVYLNDPLMVSLILQSNGTDSPPQSALKKMLDSRNLIDVIIKTESGNFPCHKLVLSSASEYFKAMFSTDFKEKNASVVDWVGVFESDVVRDLLDYLYTGQAPPNFSNTCIELVEVAHMCLMDRLKTLCVERLKEILTVENMEQILSVATKCEAEELQQAAVTFIVENIDFNDP